MRNQIVAGLSLAALCGLLLHSSHAQALSSNGEAFAASFKTRHQTEQKTLLGQNTKLAIVPVLLVAAASGAAAGAGTYVGVRVTNWLLGNWGLGSTSTPPPTDITTATDSATETATSTSAAQVRKVHRVYASLDAMFNPGMAAE